MCLRAVDIQRIVRFGNFANAEMVSPVHEMFQGSKQFTSETIFYHLMCFCHVQHWSKGNEDSRWCFCCARSSFLG